RLVCKSLLRFPGRGCRSIRYHPIKRRKIFIPVDPPFEWRNPLYPDNGSDTPKVIKSIPITSHFRQWGNTLSQSALVLSAMESFTGTTKRTRVPATLRIKEIALILQQLPRKVLLTQRSTELTLHFYNGCQWFAVINQTLKIKREPSAKHPSPRLRDSYACADGRSASSWPLEVATPFAK